MARRRLTWSITALACLGALPAQETRPPAGTGRAATPAAATSWIELSEYDPRSSRAAFAACDASRDDRIDVREAIAALPNMGTLEAPLGFRLLDGNRDGFIHWDEFDGRYQRMVKEGAKFLFRPVRAFVPPKTTEKLTPANQTEAAITVIMTMTAEDDDPELNKSEFVKLLDALKQPANLAATFPILDGDRSGGLSAQELGPVVAKVPYLLELAKNAPQAVVKPTVSETLLARRLAMLHPTLGRWSAQIFRAADHDGDGKLSIKEIDPSAK